jgi:hypothetical protein
VLASSAVDHGFIDGVTVRRARLACGRSWVRAPKSKAIKLTSDKLAALRNNDAVGKIDAVKMLKDIYSWDMC